MQRLFLTAALGAAVLAAVAGDARAQQATIGTPARGLQEGFFERMGTQWGLQGPNWSMQFGGANQAIPQFGGFDPNAGLSGGFGIQGRGFSGNFNFFGGQGNTRAATSSAPSVTGMNGQWGYVADTSISPFVIGLVPVVGGGGAPIIGGIPGFAAAPGLPPQMLAPAGPSRVQRFLAEGPPAAPAKGPRPAPGAAVPGAGDLKADLDLGGPIALPAEPGARKLAIARESTAGQAVMSVAEAAAARQAEEQSGGDGEARVWLERAKGAEEAGKPKVAAIYYRMAAKRASGDLQKQAVAGLEGLKAGDAAER